MKYFWWFILILLMDYGFIWAQCSPATPDAYTPELGLRLYLDGDTPCADSVRANALAIDGHAQATNDTLTAIKTDIYSVIKYTGGLKNAVVTNTSLATEVDTSRIKTTGNDNIYSNFNFYGNLNYYKHLRPLLNEVYWLASAQSMRWLGVRSKYVFTDQVILFNPSNPADSIPITYANGITNITGTVEADTIKGLAETSYSKVVYAVVNASDSVLTIPYTNVVFLLVGNNVTNLEKIIMTGIPAGSVHFLTIKIHDSGAPYYDVTLEDMAFDGNLQIAGNYTMSLEDTIELMYNDNEELWHQISRSNN